MYSIERDNPSLLCALLVVVETKMTKDVHIPTPIAVMCSCIHAAVFSKGSADGRQMVQAITLHLSATAGREMLNCITFHHDNQSTAADRSVLAHLVGKYMFVHTLTN